MSNNLIYIAGPITNGSTAGPRQAWKNVENAMRIYGQLIHKGYSPILPHFSYFYWLHADEERMDHDSWLEMDYNYINACDSFFYMEPEVYGKAAGAKSELEYAKDLDKIIYTSMVEVPDYPKTFKSMSLDDV